MQGTPIDIWWTYGVGTFVLLLLAIGFISSIVLNQRRFITAQRKQFEELHRAEETLRESRELYRDLVENINDVIFTVDEGGIVTFISPVIEQLSGHHPTELIGKPFTELVYSKDFLAFQKSFHRPIFGHLERTEYRIITKSGELRWVRSSNRPILKNGSIVGLRGVLWDITDQKQAEERLAKTLQEVRNLAAHQQSIREEERMQIAREIHDQLGQTLTALKMDLAVLDRKLKGKMNRNSVQDEIASMHRMIDNTIQYIRKLVAELRPDVLDNLGLKAAIEWQVRKFRDRAGIDCRFRSAIEDQQIDRERSTALFRILQEALTNVARHAKATKVEITLNDDSRNLLLEIKDNGKGIPVRAKSSKNSFGLLGMRERALVFGGEIKIDGVKGQGTIISARIPRAKDTIS